MTENANNKFGVEYISTSIAMVHKYGLIPSLLYGLIWSKCQLKTGTCYASETQLGKELGGVTRQTISKYIQILREDDLIDVSPRKKRYPNVNESKNKGKKSNFSGEVLIYRCKHENVKRLDEMMKSEIKRIRSFDTDDSDFEGDTL